MPVCVRVLRYCALPQRRFEPESDVFDAAFEPSPALFRGILESEPALAVSFGESRAERCRRMAQLLIEEGCVRDCFAAR